MKTCIELCGGWINPCELCKYPFSPKCSEGNFEAKNEKAEKT